MIAAAKPLNDKEKHDDSAFETMLPAIERQARHSLGGIRRELQDDLVAEVVALAYCMYKRLVERGKSELAFASVLARFAIKQVRAGRRAAGKANIKDVTSYACRKKNRIKRHPLGNDHEHDQERSKSWPEEILVEDRHATPADIACCRIDFNQWLQSLDRRQRKIAKTLAKNESTQATARKFNLTSGRISQIRRELERAWLLFQGELPKPASVDGPSITAVNRSLAAVDEAV